MTFFKMYKKYHYDPFLLIIDNEDKTLYMGGQMTEAILHDRLSLSSATFFTKDIF